MPIVFTPLPSEIHLQAGRLDLFQFSLQRDCSPLELATLSAAELSRGQRFYFARHQRRFATARVILRKILANYLQQPPANLDFLYHPQGKPYLCPSLTDLQFNLSHSEELALLAVSTTHPLGVDLEFFSQRPYLALSQTIFSSREHQALKNLPKALQPLGFFKLWSQKEAFIKALGLGLSYPTANITLPFIVESPYAFHDPQGNTPWLMSTYMPSLSCCAALCYHPSITIIRHFMV